MQVVRKWNEVQKRFESDEIGILKENISLIQLFNVVLSIRV